MSEQLNVVVTPTRVHVHPLFLAFLSHSFFHKTSSKKIDEEAVRLWRGNDDDDEFTGKPRDFLEEPADAVQAARRRLRGIASLELSQDFLAEYVRSTAAKKSVNSGQKSSSSLTFDKDKNGQQP